MLPTAAVLLLLPTWLLVPLAGLLAPELAPLLLVAVPEALPCDDPPDALFALRTCNT